MEIFKTDIGIMSLGTIAIATLVVFGLFFFIRARVIDAEERKKGR
jgi:hypothetical protein